MKNKINFLMLIGAIFFSGCASKIMESYVGKDIRMAMLDYGPPANAFDLGDGRRAFQWVRNSSYTTPTYISSNSYGYGHGTVYGNSYSSNFNANYNASAWVSTNTVITGGQTINSTCVYTAFAKWDKQRKTWIITGYKKPSLMCE